MKKLTLLFSFICIFAISANAQIVYKDGYLTFNRDRYPNFTTSWAGWAHYWGSTNSNGIKMCLWIAIGACISTCIAEICIRVRMKI